MPLPAGVWTIGCGHNAGVLPGDVISAEQADAFLQEDVTESARAVNQLVTGTLTQNRFDVQVSFIFNLGIRNFELSTLLKKLDAGDYAGAAEEVPDGSVPEVNNLPTW